MTDVTVGRFYDIDALTATGGESSELVEPVTVRLFGEDWALPGELPLEVLLTVSSWIADSHGDLTVAQALALVGKLVPADVLTAWQARGLTADQLAAVVAVLTGVYFGT